MKTTYAVPFRRKRTGKTDYKKRLYLLTSGKNRVVVRRSLKHLTIQLVKTGQNGDIVLASAHTRELAKLGWKHATSNTPAAYLCGLLFARKSMEKGHSEGVLDIGRNTSMKGGVLYSAVKGILDNGFNVPIGKEALPEEKRLKGEHIAEYAKKTQGNQFSKVKKQAQPTATTTDFEAVKKKLLQLASVQHA